MMKMMKEMAMVAAVSMMVSATGIQAFAADSTLISEAQQLESGETLAFGSLDELKGFLRFYVEDYRLYDYVQYKYGKSADGKATLALEAAQLYDRDSVEAQILATFGAAQGTTAAEKAAYTSKLVYNKMSYDVNYQYTSMDKAIADRTGVCWHYAKIAMIMLNKAGVDCEVQTVKYQGVQHALCKCVDEVGEVFYIDPVGKRTHISEAEFQATYVPVTLYQ